MRQSYPAAVRFGAVSLFGAWLSFSSGCSSGKEPAGGGGVGSPAPGAMGIAGLGGGGRGASGGSPSGGAGPSGGTGGTAGAAPIPEAMGGGSSGSAAVGGASGGGPGWQLGGAAGAAGTSSGGAGSGGNPSGGASEIAGAGGGSAGSSGESGAGAGGIAVLPDPGTEGDGDFMVGPSYSTQPELTNQGKAQGRSFSFSMPLASSDIFDGKDPTLDPGKVNTARSISVYVPAAYRDGDFAPVLIIQDGPGELGQVKNALDNLTGSQDANRRLPAFIVIAVQNGGNDAIGSERGLEYDTLSDRYARFIQLEVMPAVQANADVKATYPNLRFTQDPSGRAALGCSSGGAAAFTMAWFRPDLFARVIAYSTTLVAQQDPDAPESEKYPHGAWEYHSDSKLIENDVTAKEKQTRFFINVNENDLRSGDAESTRHNWVMANQRTAAALKAKGFHYRFVLGRGKGHCDASVIGSTLADALIWVWRGYEPRGR